MDEFNSERSKPWNMYTDSPHSPPQTGGDGEGPWKNFGTSMNAISFGFVATAILISMFLIMAIFEHLFRPNASFPLPQHGTDHSHQDSRPMHKLVNPQPCVSSQTDIRCYDGWYYIRYNPSLQTIAYNSFETAWYNPLKQPMGSFVTGTSSICVGLFGFDARPTIPYLHCPFGTSTLLKGRSALAFSSAT